MSFPSGENNKFFGNTVRSSKNLTTDIIKPFRSDAYISIGTTNVPAGTRTGMGGYVGAIPSSIRTNTVGEIGQWNIIKTTSIFPLFAGLTLGNSIYIGFPEKFSGINLTVNSIIDLGSGSIVTEYWNGSEWKEFQIMSSQGFHPYTQYGNTVFQRSQNENIRFELSIYDDWTQRLLNSPNLNLYWMRFRITGTIDAVPTVSVIQNLTCFYDISSRGFTQYFGIGEPKRQLVFHINLADLTTGDVPGIENIDLTNTLTIQKQNNVFENNQNSTLAAVICIPPGIDTANSLSLNLSWFPNTNGTGTVNWVIECVPVKIGDNIDTSSLTSTLKSIIDTIAVPSSKILMKSQVLVGIETLIPGEHIALRITRDAIANPDDTYGNGVVLFDICLEGLFWK